MSKLRVALVWPKGFDVRYVMPLALGYLKSNCESENVEVRIINNALDNRTADSPEFATILSDFAPDVVGVSCWAPSYHEGLQVLRRAKELLPQVITVIGGAQASSYASRILALPEVDYLFRGEADLSFPVFLAQLRSPTPDFSQVRGLAYIRNGESVYNETERETDIDKIRIPDYDAMNLSGYHAQGYRWNTPVKENAPLWVTRGCPYRCTFCAAPQLNGKAIRKHSIAYMMDWIDKLYHERGVRWFNIVDDNFTFDKNYAKDFCRAVIARNYKDIGFGTPNGIRMQKGDAELWQLMRQAGWRTVIVAPESGSARVLQIMQKDLDLTIVPGVVEQLRTAGLKVQAFFILGYPGETIDDIKQSSDLISRCRFNFVFLNNFQPLPGTPIYDNLVEQGEIPDGLMPANYSDGSRPYTPPALRDFNFPRFVLKTYLSMALRDPLNLPYMISLFSPGMIAKKLLSNFMATFKGRRETAILEKVA